MGMREILSTKWRSEIKFSVQSLISHFKSLQETKDNSGNYSKILELIQ